MSFLRFVILIKGTPICFASKFKQLQNETYTGKSLDNRLGVYSLIEIAKTLKNPKNDLYFVFSTQEEVGLKGARTAVFAIEPDLALIIEQNFILSPKQVLKEKERYDYNIVSGWNLAKRTNPTKRQLLSEKQFKKRASMVNIDSLSCLITIQSNPDEYIDVFVRAIKHRIIAMNWKLNNNYFLFGLRKGIANPIITNKKGEYLSGQEQIKTNSDWKVIDETFTRMCSRFKTTERQQLGDYEEKQIIIGLPYNVRINQDTKKIINLIHSIEKNHFTPEKINRASLTPSTKDKRGSIFNIYNQPQEERIENIDTNNADIAMREAEREARREEEEERDPI